MEYLKQLFEYAKQPFRFYVMLTLACTALLIIDADLINVTIEGNLRLYFYIGAILGAAGVAVILCEIFYGWVKEYQRLRAAKARIERRIRNLTPEEKRILGEYVYSQNRPLSFYVTNGAIADLIRADILCQLEEAIFDTFRSNYVISTDHVWAYINTHSNLVDVAFHQKKPR